MSESNIDTIRRYLADAIAAEKGFESQLRSFAEDGDDDEVQGLFAEHARQTATQIQRLSTRLESLGGAASRTKNLVAQLFTIAPRAAQFGHLPEERTAQDLMVGYSVEMSECAMYESLRIAAESAGDSQTASLAREIGAEEFATAQRLWHLIPSRAKIAYNMATAGEVDPAIETRTADDRLV